MNKEDIHNMVNSAIENLFLNQPNIFDFTTETGQTEWNLAHHLANEIHRFLGKYDCDVDVTKHSYGNKRPDIIFHRRGTNEFNYLIVEMKYRRNEAAVSDDIEKMHFHWFGKPLEYQFGVVLNIENAKAWHLESFVNPNGNLNKAIK